MSSEACFHYFVLKSKVWMHRTRSVVSVRCSCSLTLQRAPSPTLAYKCCTLYFMALLPIHLGKTIFHSNTYCKDYKNSVKIICSDSTWIIWMEKREIGWSMNYLKPHFLLLEGSLPWLSSTLRGGGMPTPGDILQPLEHPAVQKQLLKCKAAFSHWGKLF